MHTGKQQNIAAIRLFRQKHFDETGRFPTNKETAAATGLHVNTIKNLSGYCQIGLETLENAESLLERNLARLQELRDTGKDPRAQVSAAKEINDVTLKALEIKRQQLEVKEKTRTQANRVRLERVGKQLDLFSQPDPQKRLESLIAMYLDNGEPEKAAALLLQHSKTAAPEAVDREETPFDKRLDTLFETERSIAGDFQDP